MAPRSLPRAVLLALLATTSLPLSDALRVTPGSPCTSTCASPSGLDPTDANPLQEQWRDMVCKDVEFDDDADGQKLKGCLSCLEKSTFTNGAESDQNWFLYNMRYTFDYCIFGHPNSTHAEGGICTDSDACGPLAPFLEKGIPDPANVPPYGYCDVNGDVNLRHVYDDCMACILQDRSHHYLFNVLVALNVGCQQKPSIHSVIPLNGAVFSRGTIEAARPDNRPSRSSALSTAGIASIIVGIIVLVVLAIGCVVMQMRRREGLRRWPSRHGRNRSSLSFRCQAGTIPPLRSSYYNAEYSDKRGSYEPYGYGYDHEEKRLNATTGIALTTSSANDEHSVYPPRSNRPSLLIATGGLSPPSPTHSFSHRLSPNDYMTLSSTYAAYSAVSPMSVLSSSNPRDVPPCGVYRPGWPGESR